MSNATYALFCMTVDIYLSHEEKNQG